MTRRFYMLLGMAVMVASAPAFAQDKSVKDSRHDVRDAKKDLEHATKAGDQKAIDAAKAELDKAHADLKASREKRRADHAGEMKKKWGEIMDKPAFKEEMKKHHRRMARLHHIARLAKSSHNDATASKARTLLEKEGARHGRTLEQLRASKGEAVTKGKTP